MPEPGFVTVIHPPTGNVAEVPESSLGQHYLAGWVILTDEEQAARDQPAPEPKPMSRAQAAKAKAAKADTAAGTGSDTKESE